jgi:hypothetical protein
MPTKTCKSCLTELELDNFSLQKGGKFGVTSKCKGCYKVYYENNKQKESDRKKLYYKNNTEKVLSRNYDWNSKNPDNFKERMSRWSKKNGPKRAHLQKLREERKSCATPSWLDSSQLEQIENFYWLAKDCEILTGDKYHVDHIIPLRGNHVCGLHVPWNLQVLPADINMKKGNRV